MNKKLIALTFDDGPSNVTSKILDILEGEGVTASFFLIGNNITPDSEHIIRRQVKMGCEICNHSLSHSDMTTLTAEAIRDEIATTSQKIIDVIGVAPRFFRPPYISVDDKMYENINLPFICGVDSIDWDENTTVEERISNIMNGARDGAIILMHDFTDNDRTVAALPIIIQNLRDDGYEFVTVSELFNRCGVDPYCEKYKIWTYVI